MIQIKAIDIRKKTEVLDFLFLWTSEIQTITIPEQDCFHLTIGDNVPVILSYNSQLHLELGNKDLYLDKDCFASVGIF